MNDLTMREMAVLLVVDLDQICSTIHGRTVFKNQLLRAASSVGANIHEAKYAQSNADFISKLEITLKEIYETEYWLEILYKVNAIDKSTYTAQQNTCGRIRRKLIASVKTVKAKQNQTEVKP